MIRSLERRWKLVLAGMLRLLFRSRIPSIPLSPARILVIRQHNQLGDMLCVVPLLRALRQAYPSASLSLLTSPVNHEIMLHHRYLTDVISFDKREFLGGGRIHPWRLIRYLWRLHRRRFDIAIVPSTVSTSFTSDFFSYASGAPVRIGAASINGKQNPTSFFFTYPVELDWRAQTSRHQTMRNLDILKPLDVRAGDLSVEITLTGEEQEWGNRFVLDARKGRSCAVAVHPGAGKTANRWPADRFARLLELLVHEFNAELLVTAGPMDDEPIIALTSLLSAEVQLITNEAIRRVASILKYVDILITNDTGIMHVGGAAGVPVLSLFGPTDPCQWAPLGGRNRYIRSTSGRMEDISVEEVLAAARAILKGRES